MYRLQKDIRITRIIFGVSSQEGKFQSTREMKENIKLNSGKNVPDQVGGTKTGYRGARTFL